MSKRAVYWTVIALIALIITWDIWLAVDEIRGNTISAVFRKIPEGVQLIVNFALGVVAGHIWWGRAAL